MVSEWISVKDSKPNPSPHSGQYLIATNYQHYPTEWREAWWNGREFTSPYPNAFGSRSPFRNVTHWRKVDDLPAPPEPKLTVREALKEAVSQLDILQRNGFVTIDHSYVISDAICRSVFSEALPRLRSALESEE